MFCRESVTIAQSADIDTPLFVAMAFDNDEPNTPNSRVSFFILNTTFPFTIDSKTGSASVSKSISQPGLFEVYVEVSDMGNTSLSSVGVFNVIVAPPNAFSPVFPEDFSTSFDEEITPSEPVYTFEITDEDAEDEGMVRMRLLPTTYSDWFRLEQDGNTGQLFVNTSFDREVTSNFSLTVQAVDNGNPLFRRTSEAELTVEILDINDNSPMFENAPFEVSVAEDASSGYSIFQVFAMDADIGPNADIDFSLSNSAGNFEIGATSGIITVEGTLLRADTGFYMIEIIAMDQGTPSNSAQTHINITVTEVNDNSPVFDVLIPESITIDENTTPGYEFLTVNATDADTGPAGMVDFSVSQTANVFKLQNSTLFLNSNVDYEVRTLYIIVATFVYQLYCLYIHLINYTSTFDGL